MITTLIALAMTPTAQAADITNVTRDSTLQVDEYVDQTSSITSDATSTDVTLVELPLDVQLDQYDGGALIKDGTAQLRQKLDVDAQELSMTVRQESDHTFVALGEVMQTTLDNEMLLTFDVTADTDVEIWGDYDGVVNLVPGVDREYVHFEIRESGAATALWSTHGLPNGVGVFSDVVSLQAGTTYEVTARGDMRTNGEQGTAYAFFRTHLNAHVSIVPSP